MDSEMLSKALNDYKKLEESVDYIRQAQRRPGFCTNCYMQNMVLRRSSSVRAYGAYRLEWCDRCGGNIKITVDMKVFTI